MIHQPHAPYDVDVAIVGGGPAGMSAAVRCRWVKSYRSLPCSVAVFEPGPLGGLAGWRTCSITGPGYRYLGDGLVRRIETDFERYSIPVVPERVTRIQKRDGLFWLETANGTEVRALSVIVATGMRPLANERDFLGRGLFVTYMGYEYFPKLFGRVAAAGEGGIVVFGNAKSVNLAGLAGPLLEQAPNLLWVLDEPPGVELPEMPGTVVRGSLVSVSGEGSSEAGFDAGDASDPSVPDFESEAVAGVSGVRWRDEFGAETSTACSAILLDYNAWETRTKRDWDSLGTADNGQGFVTVDQWCATSIEGVFAAGDITGRYRSTAMALGDGVNAGFSAIRFTQRRKFNREPNLFAYQSADRPIGLDERDLPEVPADAALVPVAPKNSLLGVARAHKMESMVPKVLAGASIASLVSSGGEESMVRTLVEAWMDAKMLAIHWIADSQ